MEYTFEITRDGETLHRMSVSADHVVGLMARLLSDGELTPDGLKDRQPAPAQEKRTYNKKPKEATDEKAPRTERKPRYDRDAMVVDIKRRLMKPAEIALKYGVSDATVYNVAGKEGILFARSKTYNKEEAPKTPKTQPMDVEEYADLRAAMHDHDFQSGKYSLTKKIPLREVNFAVHSQNYQHYQKIRYDE